MSPNADPGNVQPSLRSKEGLSLPGLGDAAPECPWLTPWRALLRLALALLMAYLTFWAVHIHDDGLILANTLGGNVEQGTGVWEGR